MDHYQPDLGHSHLVNMSYMPNGLDLDTMAYHLQDASMLPASPVKLETFDNSLLDYVDELDPSMAMRSFSCSSASTQSMSPQLQHQQPLPDMSAFQSHNNMYASTPEQLSSNTGSVSRKDSDDDESYRAERRRAQNRAAQRAYRQRKDQSLKQREREIETLREELDKAQRLNKTLCKVVSVLRERLKEPDLPITSELSN